MPMVIRVYLAFALLGCLGLSALAADDAPGRVCEEIQRIPAPEAHQGVAVDARYVYAIANKKIGKYDKKTGERVALWQADEAHPLIHLNAGVVVDGKLYCAHSNSPGTPATSSIEVWDAETLEHIDTYSFGIAEGSLTWIDFHEGAWWAVFAHYNKSGLTSGGTDVRWTTLVRFGKGWQREQAWVFPPAVLERFQPMSNSGGSWGADGRLYCTGHDHREMYALELPRAGSVLRLVEVIATPLPGQGIAWDRGRPSVVWGIDRKEKVMIAARLPE